MSQSNWRAGHALGGEERLDLRKEFVLRALAKEGGFRALCREYGISPKTGYKWKCRFISDGFSGLYDRSRRPKRSPEKLEEDVVCEMIRLKKEHMSWGPKKIRDLFGRKHGELGLPSESSFKRVLEKAGLVKKRRKRRASQAGRLGNRKMAEQPNDVWTVDFKGWWYTLDKNRCEPLTVRDEYSRYVLFANPLANARIETVQRAFDRLFERKGLPGTIRSDNGKPFASALSPLGLTRLSVWWLALGINLDRIDPGRPYQNGSHERMHLDIALEVQGQVAEDLKAQASALECWRDTFNKERPHEALGMRVPAEVYRPSSRRYEGAPERFDYPPGFAERAVHSSGHVTLRNTKIWISKAFVGWNVGLRQVEEHLFSVYFGRLCIGQIDLTSDVFRAVDRLYD
jgi:transposase InsO family protein